MENITVAASSMLSESDLDLLYEHGHGYPIGIGWPVASVNEDPRKGTPGTEVKISVNEDPFTTTEVKIKITKKQLGELLGKIDGLPVQQVLAQLMSAGDGYEAHQRSWRPALQSNRFHHHLHLRRPPETAVASQKVVVGMAVVMLGGGVGLVSGLRLVVVLGWCRSCAWCSVVERRCFVSDPNTKYLAEALAGMLDLPCDIVRDDILSRLDAETIISCKCVCKAWRNLISDQSFARAQLTRSRAAVVFQQSSNYILACCMDDRRNAVATFAQKRHYPQPMQWLVGSCNGLLLLLHYCPDLYICNPILGEFIKLPPFKFGGYCGLGFGFSPRTNQYKVIHVCGRVGKRRNPEAEVLTVGADYTWRSIGEVPFPLIAPVIDVQLNGALYWLVNNADKHHEFRLEICSFDVGNERVQCIAPPPELSGNSDFRLGVFDSCLCLCQASANQVCLWLANTGEIPGLWTRKQFMLENQIPFSSQLEPSSSPFAIRGWGRRPDDVV
ncbi:LOW QUALITY PROTEIN: hypothetical protein RJ640_014741 [Escallonia rubra]|uniref:F-box domain-containing protein n=1 Tax=Escallonia rubra TaxID=112253 RepID=A0AA88RIE7_9ASTE|nr:LOW QUALITY PROTEIN: hypothetical protein RJ640_014741 [Escallonia rubra]